MENADRAGTFTGEPRDRTPGGAELTLHGLHSNHRRVEVLLEKASEDIHE